MVLGPKGPGRVGRCQAVHKERPTRKGVGLFRYMMARMGNVTLQGGEYLKLIEARQGGAAAG